MQVERVREGGYERVRPFSSDFNDRRLAIPFA